MAWVTKRRGSDGVLHYQGRYRDPFGAKRTVGTYPSHRQALKAANRAEGKVVPSQVGHGFKTNDVLAAATTKSHDPTLGEKTASGGGLISSASNATAAATPHRAALPAAPPTAA